MILKNEQLTVTVRELGAELTALRHNLHQVEYIWPGKPDWPKHSPVLFPVVGALNKGHFRYQGKQYAMGRHGFARERSFAIEEQRDDQVTFRLDSDALTLAQYPFPFRFRIWYLLKEDTLSVNYQVTNTGTQPLHFSLGAHPAFNVPLIQGLAYDDYYLQFSVKESAERWPITPDGLIAAESIPFFRNEDRLALKKSLFYKDALVFKTIQSDRISIQTDKSPHGLEVHMPGFPFLGLWSAKDADFVCIEPWCGIADTDNFQGEISEKEGIITLDPAAEFIRQWSVKVY